MLHRVMVVDDDAPTRAVIEAYLTSEGHAVIPVSDGYGALQYVEHFQPDLLLLDLAMPWMDGFEVCRRLRQNPQTAAVPIVAMAALDQFSPMEQILACGADDFVVKPVRKEDLLARVQALLSVCHTGERADRLTAYVSALDQELRARRNRCRIPAVGGDRFAAGEGDPGWVLIVDRDVDSQVLYANLLREDGCGVFVARTGAEAATLAAQYQPDALLVALAAVDETVAALGEWLGTRGSSVPAIVLLPHAHAAQGPARFGANLFSVAVHGMDAAFVTTAIHQAIRHGKMIRARST